MLARALLVTFQQALRSIALTLFPLTFVAMLAWATAGSSSGNTGDPVRAAIWLWLGAHLIPFSLHLPPAYQAGVMSFLPIAAALIPFFAIRNGFSRSKAALGKDRPARIFFILWYLIFIVGATFLSSTSEIQASHLFAPIYALILLLIATTNYSSPFFSAFKLPAYLFLTLSGLALIAFGASLALHFAVVKSLTIVLQPGWIGGVLLLALQILYIPNIAIAGLSYFFGGGFTVGAGTLISPTHFQIQGMPAIPLLGGLPTAKHPLYLIALIALLISVITITISIVRTSQTLRDRFRQYLLIAIMGGVVLLGLGFLSSGGLLTRELNPVGARWWFLSSVFLVSHFALLISLVLIPAGIKKFLSRSES